MNDAEMPDRPLWTKHEAINCLAYGVATGEDLVHRELVIFLEKWLLLPDEAPSMMGMLRRLAGGEPLWNPPAPPPGTPDFLADMCAVPAPGVVEDGLRVGQLIERMREPPSELAEKLEADHAAFVSHRSAHRKAENELGNAVSADDDSGNNIRTVSAPDLLPYTGYPANTDWYRKSEVLALKKRLLKHLAKNSPDQEEVTTWLMTYYQAALDRKQPRPVQKAAFYKCGQITGAIDRQMRVAMKDDRLKGLKRWRGERNR